MTDDERPPVSLSHNEVEILVRQAKDAGAAQARRDAQAAAQRSQVQQPAPVNVYLGGAPASIDPKTGMPTWGQAPAPSAMSEPPDSWLDVSREELREKYLAAGAKFPDDPGHPANRLAVRRVADEMRGHLVRTRILLDPETFHKANLRRKVR